MVKSLPVAAPLHSYEIGSRFGVRGDPMNGHAALHTGTDFRAPYMSPVYATAAGVVTFSGYRDDYGKIVEIDHGNGLVTRYGHLNRGDRIGRAARRGADPDRLSRQHRPRDRAACALRGRRQRRAAGPGEIHGSGTDRSGCRTAVAVRIAADRQGGLPLSTLGTRRGGSPRRLPRVRGVGYMGEWRKPRRGSKYRAWCGVAIRSTTPCRSFSTRRIAAPDYPEEFAYRCPLPMLRRAEDAYVDQLYDAAPAHGATLIAALFPRSYIDANRAADDLDPAILTRPAAAAR